VLHGSSGLDDEQLRRAVGAGIAKVNIATYINAAFTAAVRSALRTEPRTNDLRRYLGPGREAMARAVAEKLAVLASPIQQTAGSLP
jgi:fructose-bisphosphate aldolase class II